MGLRGHIQKIQQNIFFSKIIIPVIVEKKSFALTQL